MSARVMERTSPVVVVDGMFAGRPQQYEVVRERWFNQRTRRWHTVWNARHAGDWAWHTGRTLETALRHAACVRRGKQALWVAGAVAHAREAIA